jgi:hypothetical protein
VFYLLTVLFARAAAVLVVSTMIVFVAALALTHPVVTLASAAALWIRPGVSSLANSII